MTTFSVDPNNPKFIVVSDSKSNTTYDITQHKMIPNHVPSDVIDEARDLYKQRIGNYNYINNQIKRGVVDQVNEFNEYIPIYQYINETIDRYKDTQTSRTLVSELIKVFRLYKSPQIKSYAAHGLVDLYISKKQYDVAAQYIPFIKTKTFCYHNKKPLKVENLRKIIEMLKKNVLMSDLHRQGLNQIFIITKFGGYHGNVN